MTAITTARAKTDHQQARAVEAERAEDQDSDERAGSDTHRAGGHVDRHAKAAPPGRQEAAHVERSQRMERARAEA
ncbi:MAG: hypothetical protein AUG94_00690 [Actinobacteria bacterium 13_1_20CM_4_66_15]|nr:MAG: hypothetical protein AUG94_00690 [Actinobacteria bacterium 13_1_20CM_4_66_15]